MTDYVTRNDPRNPFKNDKAEFAQCEACGALLWVPEGSPKFCNYRDEAGCSPEKVSSEDCFD